LSLIVGGAASGGAAAGCARGCERGPSEVDLLLDQANALTFQAVAQIGPHHLEAVHVTEEVADGSEEIETMDLRWGDWDNFQIREIRDGEVRQEIRVVQGKAYVRTRDGRFKERRDAEVYRVKMSQVWNRWGLAMEPFSAAAAYDAGEQEIIEGRRARRYDLRLATAEELAAAEREREATGGQRRKRRQAPAALSGFMLIDEGSGVRLVAEMEGRLRAESGRERVIRFRERRAALGETPVIEKPALAGGERRF